MHDNREIERLRPHKNFSSPDIPYHFLHENEPAANGQLQKVNTIFLTGKECAFKCLMCDLWKNTLNEPTPPGAIIRQIDYALARLPGADVIKLYNSSNFFDQKAVPPADYQGIAERLRHYQRVIVENHPKLCGEACLEFNDMLNGTLEIAMGLETIHPDVLPRLNKQMTAEDFKQAAAFLISHKIDVRAFVLLNPPYLTGRHENIQWAFNTVKFAFESGAGCCSIIPTRPGNGIMELLYEQQHYIPPTLDMLEEVFERSLHLQLGRVFVDTWDIGFLSNCPICFESRKRRLEAMNSDQTFHQGIACSCHLGHA
ncbi:radical SAM protein [Mucilaginibacter ginsenosidivorans]|uniref:Radical SAM protein n=1 Tax=Mucilaginibacter ginsenosidivorans TaxID=398053 RepID=A0A5B8UZG4_9SPHI|nr:radical SAM protein [Mucilaginibacter ginsenosidivorans]QEC63761.1 radical SAM protein [Mucilaginibacter ginsenosidivorans]